MITQKQITALRYMIFNAKEGNDLMKQILVFLLHKSDGLKKEVRLTLWQDRWGYTAKEIDAAARSFHGLVSCNQTTHLNELLSLIGTEFEFDVHAGHFDAPTERLNTEGQFGAKPGEGFSGHENDRAMPVRYTFWLSLPGYSGLMESLEVTREEIGAIDLKRSGLYPSLDR